MVGKNENSRVNTLGVLSPTKAHSDCGVQSCPYTDVFCHQGDLLAVPPRDTCSRVMYPNMTINNNEAKAGVVVSYDDSDIEMEVYNEVSG